MQDNPNTENLPLDNEDWELAFAPYQGFPGPVLTLGFHFTVLKKLHRTGTAKATRGNRRS